MRDAVSYWIGIESGLGIAAKGILALDRGFLVRQKEPMEENSTIAPTYAAPLASIQERIQSAQVRVSGCRQPGIGSAVLGNRQGDPCAAEC